ncbi:MULTISPECIES: hypothetical protein [unclassified Bacillus (in: firmicutes)]|nr:MULTISPECIES: hypothetical protein [unclassified Bacillus (in: firmicutes)]SFH96055.1 hypothetical protein SAMN04488574_10154 [Bacillus sp. 71mf]SFS94853.1 hypothetical protein SAMN04488145_105236 [Bacillus sp. 103mf]
MVLRSHKDEGVVTLEMVKNLIEAIEGIAKDRRKIDNVMFGDDSDEL